MRISDWSSDVCSSDLEVTNCPSTCSDNNCNGYPGATVQAPGGKGGSTSAAHCQLACMSNCPSSLNAAGGVAGTSGQCGDNGTARSEGRRGGKEWVSTCKSRWSPEH